MMLGVSKENLILTLPATVVSALLVFGGTTIEVALYPLYFLKQRGQCCTSGYREKILFPKYLGFPCGHSEPPSHGIRVVPLFYGRWKSHFTLMMRGVVSPNLFFCGHEVFCDRALARRS
jgi:hypothetical protein